MKRGRLAVTVLLVILLVSVPALADAHGPFAGAWLFGLGLGFLTGYAVAPRPVYAVPPVYYAPPPVAYPYSPSYVPAPVTPPSSGYNSSHHAAVAPPAPPSAGQSGCREWKLIDRHWEKRWDPNYGAWRNVLVERFGWVGVPCRN